MDRVRADVGVNSTVGEIQSVAEANWRGDFFEPRLSRKTGILWLFSLFGFLAMTFFFSLPALSS